MSKLMSIKRVIWFIGGIFLMALAFNLFLLPHNIMCGVSGMGVLAKSVFNLDPSLVILGLNILFLILSFIFLGKESTANTILGSILYPVMIKLTEFIPNMITIGELEPFVEVACGAALLGFGLGFVFKAGFTTGGVDILNQIVSKYGKMNIGTSMFYTDGIIIALSLVAFDLSTLVYSVINLFIVSTMTDKVVLGISQSKALYIITEHETSIKKYIIENLSHGVTILDGRGGYTGNFKKVIMCIVPTSQYYLLKDNIKRIDPEAFFVTTDAYEVSGGSIRKELEYGLNKDEERPQSI